LSATIGSVFVARRAGTQQANNAITANLSEKPLRMELWHDQATHDTHRLQWAAFFVELDSQEFILQVESCAA
jgi:hypothetical protein